jgi:hypothetical protein
MGKSTKLIDPKIIIISEAYLTVALSNLGYDEKTNFEIGLELDRLYEKVPYSRIRRKAEKIEKRGFQLMVETE